MKRLAKDPGLNVLANQLKLVEWRTPLVDSEAARVSALLMKDRPGFHITLLPDAKTWVVRSYLGGDTWTIGLIEKNPETACRFADMAQLYFWKYRVRGAAEPDASRFNISKERAQADLEGETSAVLLLKTIEEHLLKVGTLRSGETRTAERRRLLQSRQSRRTLWGRQQQFEDQMNARFDGLLESMREVQRLLKETQSVIRELVPSLAPAQSSEEIQLDSATPEWLKDQQ